MPAKKRGGKRKGAGRPEIPEGERRRNRVVVMVTDRERDRLTKLADKAKVPVGTLAYQLIAEGLRRKRS